MNGDSGAGGAPESPFMVVAEPPTDCVSGSRSGYIEDMATANPTATRATDPVATPQTRTEKGISLARGPALILGTILLAAGLYFMYKAHTYPRFANFPNGTATKNGNFFFGIFGANGWTGLFTAVCGGLLLFGAAQHLMAKTMSLIVGCALGAAAIIAWVSGDVLGMAAANGWTEIGWAVCSLILLFNSLMPRRQRTVVVEDGVGAGAIGARRRRYGEPAAAATAAPAGAAIADREAVANREPVADREPVAAREPVANREPVADREPVAGDEAATTRQPVADRGAAPADAPVAGDEAATTGQPVADRGAAPADAPVAGDEAATTRQPVADRGAAPADAAVADRGAAPADAPADAAAGPRSAAGGSTPPLRQRIGALIRR
jgi:hypothetical protein